MRVTFSLSPFFYLVFSAMLCKSLSHLSFLASLSRKPDLSAYSFERALRHQPFQASFYVPLLAYALLFSGNLLVLSSMWALGITGTYLGDYFGILMDAPVTGFPFNITGAPMYYGSSMSFLGSALLYGRPAGVVLAGMVFMVYQFALALEE